MHDPTTLDRQGNDSGSQYRSAIFTHNAEQAKIAVEMTEYAQKFYKLRKIVTKIEPAGDFYNAEDYHQVNCKDGYQSRQS